MRISSVQVRHARLEFLPPTPARLAIASSEQQKNAARVVITTSAANPSEMYDGERFADNRMTLMGGADELIAAVAPRLQALAAVGHCV
jgi:hypothetical protein